MHQNSLDLKLLSLLKLLMLVVDEWNIKCASILKFCSFDCMKFSHALMALRKMVVRHYEVRSRKSQSNNATHNLKCLCIGCKASKQAATSCEHALSSTSLIYVCATSRSDGMTAARVARMSYLKR